MSDNIKISIITIVKNGMPYLEDTLKSFQLQDYKNKELIVVYSNSYDKTFKVLKSCKFISKLIIDNDSRCLYGSLNKGIQNTTGKLIGLLHSEDIFFDDKVLTRIVNRYKKNNFEVAYGSVVIVARHNIRKIIRYWKSTNFKKNKIKFGWMPPHTSLFISNNLKKKKYSTNYQISSDYEYLIKLFNKKHRVELLDFNVTIMRTGGLSNKKLILKLNEDLKITKKYFYFFILVYFLKVIRKINQFYYYNRLIDNNAYIRKFYLAKYNFFYNPNKIINKKKFIMSAYNMAYISFVHNKVNFNKKNVFLWPDGISSKIFKNKKKISGRKILSALKSSNDFENIYLISKKEKAFYDYIKNKFKDKKIYFIEAPFGGKDFIISELRKKIKKIKSKSLLILTLPTPKQEYVAAEISNVLEDYKIVCTGGAINYNSKLVKIPPKIVEAYFESFWRLREDTFRRLIRLVFSILLFIKKKFFRELSDI